MDVNFDITQVNDFGVNEGFENKYSYLWAVNDYTPCIVDGTSFQIESQEIRDPWSNSWKIRIKASNGATGQNLVLTSHNNHQRQVNLMVCLNLLDTNNAIYCPEGEPRAKKLVPRDAPGKLTTSVSDVAVYRVPDDIHSHMDSLLVDGKLRILLRIWNLHINKQVDNDATSLLAFAPKKLKSTLTPSLAKLFMDGNFADVIIRVKDTEISAHRVILAARSDVFAAMFNARMTESNTSSVEIPEFSAEVVKGMIEWIYTDNTEIEPEDAASYLQIADLYNLEGLKYEAEFVYAKNLTFENVIEASKFSILYKTKLLRSEVVNFIAKNKKQLILDPAFNSLPDTMRGQFLDVILSS